MKKVLISTIMRNQAVNVKKYFEQLTALINQTKDCEFYLSIYQNDSTDGTPQLLKILVQKNKQFFSLGISLSCQILNTSFYPHGSADTSLDRVKNSANARNATLIPLVSNEFDYILCIQGDVSYNSTVLNCLLQNQPQNWQVYSGMGTLTSGAFYDTWCTRNNEEQEWFGGFKTQDNIIKLYSVFSGFCLYDAKLMKELNINFKPYDQVKGIREAQIVMVCKQFQRKGYSGIYMNRNVIIGHYI